MPLGRKSGKKMKPAEKLSVGKRIG